jgi:hypothetical protein
LLFREGSKEEKERMNLLPTKCPVCGGDLIVTRLHCPSCETSIEGSFVSGGTPLQEAFSSEQLRSLLPFSRLSQEQLYFMLTFVRCEGRFNRMEEELNLSYPTLRGRLDEIIRALGFEPGREPEAREDAARESPVGEGARAISAEERQAILDTLSRGEINVEEARRRLRGEQPAPAQTEPNQTEPTQTEPNQTNQPEE